VECIHPAFYKFKLQLEFENPNEMKLTKLLTLLLAICPLAGIAQKIKYEDVFKLINSGAIAEAEPQLKAFMTDPKNADHANSFVQMGVILEKRFYGMDILGDTSVIASQADSIEVMYKKAITLIDEKELKKNSDLYQTFYRRDLRTGEFGIKLSDVHLDLEKKIENVGRRLAAIRSFRTMLLRINGRNNLSASLYKQMVDKTSSYRELLFLFTEEDVVSLDRMRDNAQGLYTLINEMKAAAKELGTDYYQNFQDFKVITTFGVDGLAQQSVFGGQLDLWDYETWASAARNDYYSVKQYRLDLLKKEAEVTAAQAQLDQGLSSEDISLSKIIDQSEVVDSDGVAVDLLKIKTERVEVGQLTHPAINPTVTDTTNIYGRFVLAQAIEDKLAALAEAYSEVVMPDNLSLAAQRYPGVLEQYYGGATGLSSFLQEYGVWLSQTTNTWQSISATLAERQKYAITGADSIPLFISDSTAVKKYLTMQVVGETDAVAGGIDLATNEGFVVWSGAEREITAKKSFKIGAISPEAKSGIITSAQFSFYIFNPAAEVDNLVLISTSGVGALKWSNLITAPNEPVDFRYDEALDQVTVFFVPQDQLPSDGSVAYVVIDRLGKVR
jgi:hypothetical protein